MCVIPANNIEDEFKSRVFDAFHNLGYYNTHKQVKGIDAIETIPGGEKVGIKCINMDQVERRDIQNFYSALATNIKRSKESIYCNRWSIYKRS